MLSGEQARMRRLRIEFVNWYSQTSALLRPYEWALAVYFLYAAAISPAFYSGSAWRGIPFLFATAGLGAIFALAQAERLFHPQFFSYVRDWAALALLLMAYREMDWFKPLRQDHHLEHNWILWDRLLLYQEGWKHAIEATGFLPLLLELSYVLVYAVGPFTLAILYLYRRRDLIDAALFLYILGTLIAYALFPYFPSWPPRSLFPNNDLPAVHTPLRVINLWLVEGYGIHSSVFPSAHVSSAFSAAWALLLYFPEKKRCGGGMLAYAILVSIATFYGRYHYAVDALAGFGVSVAAALATIAVPRFRPAFFGSYTR